MKKPFVILFTSPQGGSGKSTMAVNTSIHLAKLNYKVLLIDFACFGSLPSMLKIPIRGKGMSSLITAMEQNESSYNFDQFNPLFKESLISYADLPQMQVLLSASPLKMEKMTVDQADQMIKSAMMEHYDFIVIDTSSELCERNIACVDNADYILIPALQDVTSGWKIILYREILDNFNVNKDKVSLVINRCNKYSTFHNHEFEAEVGYSIIGEINELAKIIQRYVNMGIPIENSGKRKAALPFQRITQQLLKKAGYK